MLTKPSPDAIKMLKLIEEYFNKVFKTGKYSAIFCREFSRLFKIDNAFHFSIYGSNDAYIVNIGVIKCWDFEKNIKNIENVINKIIERKNERIQWLENLIPLVEKDKVEGKVDNTFVELFYQILEEAHKWREQEEESYAYFPIYLDQLKGIVSSDYEIIKQELSSRAEWKKDNVSDNIYQQLCEWIDLPSTKKHYGNRRWNAMKEKLALQGPLWYVFGEIKDIETAKKLIAEVFYPDQEEYYKQLEKWAESEIGDMDCSRWISKFLWTGRTMSVRQVKLLKYKGNLEKGKAYLLSKYEEKLEWDKKKQMDRAFRHSSIFDSFDENYNSFQEIWTNLENEYSLFPICICSNVAENDYPRLSMFDDWTDGIKLQHDTVHYSLFVQDMTLVSTNRYFYTYKSKYKKSNYKFIIYSDESFKLIKEYLQEVVPEVPFNENVIGCITLIDEKSTSQKIGITALLSYSKDDYSKSPKVLTKFDSNKYILASEGFQNTVGYRLFANSVIYHIAKEIGFSINLPLGNTISDLDYKLLIENVELKIDNFSFEDRYLCHFISKKYEFPKEQPDSLDISRISMRINLFHNVQHHYSTPIFQEWQFPYGKIVNEYHNYEFEKNTKSVAGDFYNYKVDLKLWSDKTNKQFLFNLRILCYLNWVYVCNEKGNLKKLSSLWLYEILYSCYLEAYHKDRAFFSSVLYYTLIQNERIFIILIDKLLEREKQALPSTYNSATIFYHLVRYYSNGYKGWGRNLSSSQLYFLNNGKKRHELLNLFSEDHICEDSISDNEVLDIASRLFDFIKNMLDNDIYHLDILEMFKDMKPFEIPVNFSYERRQSYTYREYNGDYTGTYVHDEMGYTNDEIDIIFDGNPDAYWNID